MYIQSNCHYFKWKNSQMGGGGYITGLLQHPFDKNILYARCDVAGVFKSEDGAVSWRPVNKGMKLCHHHNVQSIAISPHNPDILFRCSGEARGNHIVGSIHKTVDGGETWYSVCEEVDFYGNGETRMCGEVIAIHPAHPGFIAAGGYSAGVWVSEDCGETWHLSGLPGERISCLLFDPSSSFRIYAATLSDLGLFGGEEAFAEGRLNDLLHKLREPGRGLKGKLFCSEDLGKSWSLIYEGLEFAELAAGGKQPGTLYSACLKGIYKSEDFGKTWTPSGNGLPSYQNIRFCTLSIDSRGENDTLYTAAEIMPDNNEMPVIPIYRSTDGAKSWQLIHTHTTENFINLPAYLSYRAPGWAISKVRPSLHESDGLFMTNYWGVYKSCDGGIHWNANHFTGIESICGESIQSHPVLDKTILVAMADFPPFISRDNGKKYTKLAAVEGRATTGSSILGSRFDPSLLLYGFGYREKTSSCLLRSTDFGKTAELVLDLEYGLFVQALAECHFNKGIFYAYIDGTVASGAGLYKSEDWGRTWSRMSSPFPEYIRVLPHEKDWIEAELLSVTVCQIKNVCGANQLLCTDPHNENRILVGEWTEGIFATEDGGKTWSNIGKALPFRRDRASALNVIKMDDNHPGVIYAGFIREGLWKTADYGQTWYKLFPKDDMPFNASSLAIGGPGGTEIFAACEPLYWSACPSSVYFSPDKGESWYAIHDETLGAIRWKGIAVEKSTGALHAVSCGNGIFRAERE